MQFAEREKRQPRCAKVRRVEERRRASMLVQGTGGKFWRWQFIKLAMWSAKRSTRSLDTFSYSMALSNHSRCVCFILVVCCRTILDVFEPFSMCLLFVVCCLLFAIFACLRGLPDLLSTYSAWSKYGHDVQFGGDVGAENAKRSLNHHVLVVQSNIF